MIDQLKKVVKKFELIDYVPEGYNYEALYASTVRPQYFKDLKKKVRDNHRFRVAIEPADLKYSMGHITEPEKEDL